MLNATPMTASVTGATSGIGFFTAAGLADAGYTVFVTGRDKDRGRTAVRDLRQRSGDDNVHFLAADHSTVRGNIQLATELTGTVDWLRVLVNNVGGIYVDRWETSDGYEGPAMNFVGPFALTERLRPLLRADGGRCVNVVSSAFTMVKDDPFNDLDMRAGYVGIRAYGHAKLLNVLWTQALAEHEPALAVYPVNPGMAWTPSTQQLTPKAVPAWRFVWPLVRWFQRRASAEKAAQVCVRVASMQEVQAASGSYLAERTLRRPAEERPGPPRSAARLGPGLVARSPCLHRVGTRHSPGCLRWSQALYGRSDDMRPCPERLFRPDHGVLSSAGLFRLPRWRRRARPAGSTSASVPSAGRPVRGRAGGLPP